MADIEGTWSAQDVKVCARYLRLKLSQVQVKSEGENTWRVSAKVANTMNCTVTKTGDTFIAGKVMSTMMMPVPRLEVGWGQEMAT